MQMKLNGDAISGLLLVLIGAAFAIRSLDYGVGSAAQMGSGYFPLLLGGGLVSTRVLVVIGRHLLHRLAENTRGRLHHLSRRPAYPRRATTIPILSHRPWRTLAQRHGRLCSAVHLLQSGFCGASWAVRRMERAAVRTSHRPLPLRRADCSSLVSGIRLARCGGDA